MHPAIRQLTALGLTLLAAATASAQTPIYPNQRSFPVVIDQPGHYQLTGPLNVPAGTHGIVINAANVLLDLNGYTVKGPGSCGMTISGSGCPAPGNDSGIQINGANATVRNGSVQNFVNAGIAFQNIQVVLEDLTLRGNYRAGVYRTGIGPVQVSNDYNRQMVPAVLRRVMAVYNGVAGAQGYGLTIENAHLSQNLGAGLVSLGLNKLNDSVVDANRTYGIEYPVPIYIVDTTRGSHFAFNGMSSFTPGVSPSSMGGNFRSDSGAF